MSQDHVPANAMHLLGSRGYSVAIAGSGAEYSLWNGLAITRWHPAGPGSGTGAYVYVRDVDAGAAWSATASPCGGRTRCWFDPGLARFARRDGDIVTTLEVAVDSERPVEVRGVGVRNTGKAPRDIELTSYLELVLGALRGDAAHPAYSKMFVQTSLEDGVLLAWRRKKEPAEPDVWVAHALVVDGAEAAPRECETDRARFIGRDGSLAAPAALAEDGALSGTVGTVLDPVFSLRTRLRVPPGAVRRAAFVTAAAASRAAVVELIRGYLTPAACSGVFARARRVIGADDTDARRFQRLAGALLGADDAWRAPPDVAARGKGGAPVLWAKGISGDLPIVLLRVDAAGQLGLAEHVLRAQGFWRDHQLPADVVVLNAGGDDLRNALQKLADAVGTHEKLQGNVFVLPDGDIGAAVRDGLYTAAAIVLDGRNGDLTMQVPLAGDPKLGSVVALPPPRAAALSDEQPRSTPQPGNLEFWNGLGGFTRDGREYVTVLRPGQHTPAPWSHVVANPGFGFLVTTTGGGYAWAGNSQQNQITAWSNDAVCDPPGGCFLLRDHETGAEWGATASPLRSDGATYVARFGPGYARFDASVGGIETELVQCVAASDPVQLSRLRLHNRSGSRRRIDVAQVVAWTLGAIGGDPHATTRVEPDRRAGAVFARNVWRDEFADATAFIACGARRAGAGCDADGRSATVATVDLAPGAHADLLFLLGEGSDAAAARALVARYHKADFDAALAKTRATWDTVLRPLQVATPERSVDLLVNRCLPYQVLACRLWARTAFYQASGAYGFRDQLQDVGALCASRPDLVRAHILLAASRQFEEGDAQHWWLPPSGKGVRTRIVDDRLWLPYIVAHYVTTTGDAAILDAQVPFLHGDALQPGQGDAFFAPAQAAGTATLFEHCARAIEVSLATGVHGLPLMGTGDWNDGMNRVGVGGKGESVWMGWFLCKVIADFAPLAEQ
ncbi:MAG TPA: glycosyl transferase family 36, partial [Rhodanobacteraceae bacterium]